MTKKKKPKNKVPSKAYSKYKVSGDKIEKSPTCPRCGPSYFLAQHKNRQTCGKCGFTQFKGN